MRFIDRLAFVLGYAPLGQAAKLGTATYPDWIKAGVDAWTDQPNLQVTENQLQLMQRLSWVFNAITIVAQTAAGTDLKVKERTGEEQKDIDNHPFEILLEKPNPLQSRFEFLESLFGYRALSGNAYVWLNRTSENAPPAEMWLIPPNRMRPAADGKLFLRGYIYDPGNGAREIPLETWEVCHFKRWHPRNRYVGLSPIEALALAAKSDLSMQEWNANYFAKDHAKVPGILAYAEKVNDSDWAKMKEDAKLDHGGTQRRVMMMRGSGEGGVQWISTGVAQKDMEFLAGRTFNKEEIYAAFAPGLSSVLAVNATEANAIAGDRTFQRMAIWPAHKAVAEKITNDILPAYGNNLRAEFDDVRVSDRALELQEESAYGLVHTIDEVRKEYYNDDPLEDERGKLLVPEVGKGLTNAEPPKDEPPPQVIPPQLLPANVVDTNEREDQQRPARDVTPPEEPMKAELRAWERFAVKRVKDGKALRDFETEIVPGALKGAIDGALIEAKTTDDVRGIFRDALSWRAYP